MKTLRAVLVCLLGAVLGCGSVLVNEGFECNQTDSTESCCLKKNPGQYERCGARAPPQRQQMLGEKGPKLYSKTLWQRRGVRLDVENPAPGVRPGQIHVQKGNGTWLYDVAKGKFYEYVPSTQQQLEAPGWVNGLLEDEEFAAALAKALKYLGETPP